MLSWRCRGKNDLYDNLLVAVFGVHFELYVVQFRERESGTMQITQRPLLFGVLNGIAYDPGTRIW